MKKKKVTKSDTEALRCRQCDSYKISGEQAAALVARNAEQLDSNKSVSSTAQVRPRDFLNSENVILRALAQCLHARKCNAPWGQTEKLPSVSELQEALNAYVASNDSQAGANTGIVPEKDRNRG